MYVYSVHAKTIGTMHVPYNCIIIIPKWIFEFHILQTKTSQGNMRFMNLLHVSAIAL